MSSSAETISICPLSGSDAPAAHALSVMAGWNQIEADWRRVVSLSPENCFGAKVAGELRGTVTSMCYDAFGGKSRGEDKIGWIGMLLVRQDCQRRGIGTRLLRAVIETLRRQGCETIRLDATQAGKPMYDRAGFVDEFLVGRWRGQAASVAKDAAASDARIRTMTKADLASVAKLDAETFGGWRDRVLARLMEEFPSHALVAGDASSAFLGYALFRPGRTAWHFGPCASLKYEVGYDLFRHACRQMGEAEVHLDSCGSNLLTQKLLQRGGMLHKRNTTRMHLGPNLAPADLARTISISGGEKM